MEFKIVGTVYNKQQADDLMDISRLVVLSNRIKELGKTVYIGDE